MLLAPVLCILLAAGAATAQSIPVSFGHGVASGDPLSDSIILWTRVTPRELNATKLAALSIPVAWQVFASPSPPWRGGDREWGHGRGRGAAKAVSVPVASGQFVTSAARDFTVKVQVDGLDPGTQHWFQFTVGPVSSPVGKFRTPSAPGRPQGSLKYAIFSCSNWGFGYFNAYDAASQMDLDLWLHLGDFIYEYGPTSYPSPTEAVRFQAPPLGLQPPNELITLADYRARYALYRQDPGLQALSAAAPLVAAWDDHEFANNAWTGGAENHSPGTEGSWDARKAAAVKAYHEWMPTRVPDPSDPVKFYRSFQFGNLATLMMLETRVVARTDPVPGTLPDSFSAIGGMGFAAVPPANWTQAMFDSAQAFRAQADAIRFDPARRILGDGQVQWVRQTTKNSLAANTKWQLYGQDTVMLDQFAPDLEAAVAAAPPSKKQLWAEAYANLTGAGAATTTYYTNFPRWAALQGVILPVSNAMKAGIRVVQALARFKITWNFDCWSGYQADKQRFLSAVSDGAADAGKRERLNAVIYGGDSHNAWAGVESLNGSFLAAEFDGASVTSPGFEDFFGYTPLHLLEAGFVASNPGMTYANMRDKGFMLVSLTPESHRLQMMTVSTIATQQYDLGCDAAFEVRAGQKSLRRSWCGPWRDVEPYASVVPATNGLGRAVSALP